MSEWSPTESEPVAAGQMIGDFRIIGLAGRGGMGEVYRALDTKLQRHVAIKLLSETYAGNPEFSARFEREARAASALSHPNIAQVYSTGRFGNRPYYVMEFVEGRSLGDILAAEGPIAGFRCLSYLIDACVALGAACDKGIIHRDIKPDNLMIDTSGRLRIVDFGLARWMDEGAKVTQTNTVIGTPNYMAPEQIMGQKVDHRADIYSLGTAFYHLFSGAAPFTAESSVGIMMKHVNEEPPPLKSVNPRIPQPICSIIEKMMAKRREDRYQSYPALIHDLELARSGNFQKTAAARKPPLPLPPPAGGSRKVRTASAAGAVLALLVLGGAYLKLRSAPVNARQSAPTRSAKQEPGDEGDAVLVTTAGGELVTISGDRKPEPPPEAAPSAVPVEASAPPPETAAAEPAAVPSEAVPNDPKKIAETESTMKRISSALGAYMEEGEPLPRSLAQLGESFNIQPGEMKDAWGNDLRYDPQGARGFRLASPGPDGKFGTADDLVMENGQMKN